MLLLGSSAFGLQNLAYLRRLARFFSESSCKTWSPNAFLPHIPSAKLFPHLSHAQNGYYGTSAGASLTCTGKALFLNRIAFSRNCFSSSYVSHVENYPIPWHSRVCS